MIASGGSGSYYNCFPVYFTKYGLTQKDECSIIKNEKAAENAIYRKDILMETRANTPISFVPGIGAARAKALEKLGITTVKELLYHFPRGYQNRGNVLNLLGCPDGTVGAFILTVATAPRSAQLKNRKTITKFSAYDDSGTCSVVFFNQPYVKDIFHVGTSFRFWGKLSYASGRPELASPVFEPCSDSSVLPDIVPVYPLTAGISQKLMSSFIHAALRGNFLTEYDDIIPRQIREKNSLPPLPDAIRMIHTPSDVQESANAMQRFAFERIFMFAINAGLSKQYIDCRKAYPMDIPDMTPFTSCLNFRFTGAQNRTVNEIASDMCDKHKTSPMSRILTGDVGSGKTICAAAAIYIAVKNGTQAALMAPTEILAVQHYDELFPLFQKLGIKAALLTGSTKKNARVKIITDLEAGKTDLIIGTHALLSPDVNFKKLGLVITDEQHRFGVMQRTSLAEKNISCTDDKPYEKSTASDIVHTPVKTEQAITAPSPHILVMSATPIPRTLAFILYGDLSVSTLDELPPGRQKTDTFAVGESYRERLYAFIRKHVEEGHQVYVICPAVDSSETLSEPSDEYFGELVRPVSHGDFISDNETDTENPLKNVTETAKLLADEIFPDIPVGYVHGKMKPNDKESAMHAFAEGRTKILVSTTVIEVGVNVPNATLIIIENAERFGLSQLHQLRGRVGRGTAKSYCVLVSECKSENARKRLTIMKNTNDGYVIAQKDLELRGPGDFFPHVSGTARQHGASDADIIAGMADESLTKNATQAARDLLTNDPYLEASEHKNLLSAAKSMFDIGINTIH